MKEPSSHLYKDFTIRALSDFIKELIRGRTNAVGQFDLTDSSTTTVVSNALVSKTSRVFLQAASAAADISDLYISAVALGSFTVTHSSDVTTRTFYYHVATGE